MKAYYSTTHTISNDNGIEEVSFECHKTFFQKLFKRPRTKKYFVFNNDSWCYKGTSKVVSQNMLNDIIDIINIFDHFNHYGIKKK